MTSRAQCISFPKSGRTWVRYMVATLGHADALEFQHDGFEFNDGSLPPHNFDLNARLARYGAGAKVIYMDRDPRDVIVSLYHQVTGRFRDFFAYEGDISAFIRDDYFGAAVLARFRALWADVLAQRDFLHVRYESLHEDTPRELKRVVSYLGLASDDARIADAVQLGKIESMRALEASGAFAEPWLRPRNGFAKVRRGEVGAFRDELSAADVAYLDSIFGTRS